MVTSKYVFPNLAAEMARNGDTLQTLSSKLGMNYQTLSARLTGKRSFELPEIFKIMQLYDDDFEILFKQSKSKAS